MKKLILSLALACAALVPVSAQELDLMQVVPNDTEVRTGTLESGIKYYIRSNKKDPQRANFHIVFDVGAIQEEDRQDGLAHFLEHMAFNGSKNFPDNSMIDYLQSIGIAFGNDLNAGTGQDLTTYMITNVPITREGIVDSVLLALHDWAGFISLNHDDIDKERGVIQEEWRMVNSDASRRLYNKSAGALFGQDNLYNRRTVIGTMENLKNFTYQDIKDFYHKWYRPDMQAFIIVGDFDVDQMEAKLKTVMADIKEFDVKTPKNKVKVEPNAEPRIAVITDPELKNTQVKYQIRLPKLAEKYNNRVIKFSTDLISRLGHLMLNDRLNNMSKEAGAPFQQAYCYIANYYEPCDIFTLVGTAREGEALKTFEALTTEMLRASRGGFVAPELDRAKANFIAEFERDYNNRNDRRNGQYVDVLMENFLNNAPYPSAQTEFDLAKQIIEGVSLEQVNAQMAAMTPAENNVIIISGQSKEGVYIPTEAEVAASLAAIQASEIAPYTENVVTRPLMDEAALAKLKGSKIAKTEAGQFGSTVFTLKNGVKVVVKPTTYKADEIIFNAFKKGGTSTIESLEDLYSVNLWGDFENGAGLADMTAKDLTRVLTGKTTSLSPSVNNLTIGYNGQSSIKDFETMLQLMYLYATAPRFDATDWGVMMDKLQTYVKGSLKDPMRIFRDSMSSAQYNNNPRMRQLDDKMLSMVSMERMKAAYEKLFASTNGMTFTITGSVDLETIKPLIEKYIGSLPCVKSKTEPAYGPYIPELFSGTKVVRFSTKQETPRVIAVNLFKADVANYTLADRLNLQAMGEVLNTVYLKTIREDAGGTYVMQNMVEVMVVPKPQAIDLALFMTDTTKIDELLPLIDAGVKDMCENGPSQENLTKATENFAKNFTDGESKNSTWNNYLYNWYGLGQDNYTTYTEVLKGVTVETVKAAANKFFDQKNRITLVQLP